MVVALGPGKFYGSGLPRPRFYTDVKLSGERVDPPLPVLDPLLSWANDAHWSMGGLNFKRQRLQGRIEGNIKKLRAEHEKIVKKRKREEINNPVKGSASSLIRSSSSVSPPLAPMVTKQRRRLTLVDEDSELENEQDEENGVTRSVAGNPHRRKPARKLGDDFDKVASETVIKEKRNPVRSENEDAVESRGSPLKRKNSSAGGKEKITKPSSPPLDNGRGTVASRTRRRKSEKEDEPAALVEPVEKANEVTPKLKKRILRGGNKTKTNGVKGSPANGTRTSPRLVKLCLN